MSMIDPSHPGRSFRKNCLEPLDRNVTEAARVLAVARHNPIACSELPRRGLTENGNSTGESGLV